jgi:thiamine-monophosphate kinase
MNEPLRKDEIIAQIIRWLPRSQSVAGAADAEFVDFDPAGPWFLAVTADSLCEEIATGLYGDGYTVGWVLVMAAMSDLAAVGAQPLGVTTVLNLPDRFSDAERDELGRGIGDACRSLSTVTLGGDVSSAGELTVSATALGLVAKDRVLTRMGARPGQLLYLSAAAGLGNAYALSRFDPGATKAAFPFRPRARTEVGSFLGGLASSAMDTSDGVLATLDEIARANGVGFLVTAESSSLLHPRVNEEFGRRGVPPWLALAGCHGEFELVFTVPPEEEGRLLGEAEKQGVVLVHAGRVIEAPGVHFLKDGKPKPIDTQWLRDRAAEAPGDPRAYIQALVEYAGKVGW